MSDGVLSGALDIGMVGAPALLVLWDKTPNSSNPVRGLAAISNNPSMLVTRNPAEDLTERNRIALPGVKIGLNASTLTLGHPDALATRLSGAGEITAHFSQAP